MELIDDPEIIEDFCKEAAGLFDELEEILEDLEEELEEDELTDMEFVPVETSCEL